MTDFPYGGKPEERREMKRKLLWLILLSLTLTLSTLASCATPASTLSEDDQAEADIYAAVVRQLYTVDHTFGEPPNFPIVYLLRATDDRAGDPRETEARSSIVAESVRGAIVAALDNLPAEFIWVDDRDEVPMDRGMVEGNGVIITLGNVHFQEDSSALVSASIYIANLAAGGRTYIVKQVDGIWQVVGDTGVIWIS